MKWLCLALLTMGLGACASAGPVYTSADKTGAYGYSETKLAEERYRVSFQGKSSTPSDAVKNMVLLRAAELAMSKGYDWFQVLRQDTDKETRTTPQTVGSYSTGTRVYRDCGLLGCTTTVTPDYTGVGVVTTRQSDRYQTAVEILLGKGEVEQSTNVYNARELYNNLIEIYRD
ncbi:hypothetical protein ATO7_09807 [Oceanococcus atlanticus]|uniref:Lipoprotein n=1 Tax=Oceanococcus atlanticus TaxID=1317117 RepID=A0A1Y1SEA2_9GAMM|nr:hypothetical protein [Oceanococcus atlanticus]ORE87327.1 hypothetical protein ATO7_09807 [Oceanococcus atlanticus]RZO87070.1 MAG: hypothetical protein EVA65_02040 [Oceanococcus sp.]